MNKNLLDCITMGLMGIGYMVRGFKTVGFKTGKAFKTMAFMAVASLFAPAALAYNAGSFSVTLDNDAMVGTDRSYTNGIFIEFNSAENLALAADTPPLVRYVSTFLPLSSNRPQGWRLRLGHQTWTPEKLNAVKPLPQERPYAGLLFVELGIYQYTGLRADTYSFRLGAVGPNSLAEEGQKRVHRILGAQYPAGWEFQISSQTVFNLGYQGHRLISRRNAGLHNQYDLSGVGRINIGNYRSEAALAFVGRWGSRLEGSFGGVGFTPGKFFNVSALAASPSGYFLFAGIESRYRFNDITVEGDRPDEVADTRIAHLQATAIAGVVYYQQTGGISFSLSSGSREFKEDKHAFNATGSIEIFMRL
ncbi:MAG: lipid A deacylase LpxR family protein [Motiliproteus sp.]